MIGALLSQRQSDDDVPYKPKQGTPQGWPWPKLAASATIGFVRAWAMRGKKAAGATLALPPEPLRMPAAPIGIALLIATDQDAEFDACATVAFIVELMEPIISASNRPVHVRALIALRSPDWRSSSA
jgi:hypothetical protein